MSFLTFSKCHEDDLDKIRLDYSPYAQFLCVMADLGRVRLGTIRNKNNWNNASKRLFGSYSHSGIPGIHSGYSAPGSRIAGIYSGIHSYSEIFPNERALSFCLTNFVKVQVS